MTPASSSTNNSRKAIWFFLGGCLMMFLCIACIAVFAAAGYLLYDSDLLPIAGLNPTPTAVPTISQVVPPTQPAATPTPPPTPNVAGEPTLAAPATAVATIPVTFYNLDVPEAIEQSPIPDIAITNLNTLYSGAYPYFDYHEVAERLSRRNYGDRVVSHPIYQVGDRRTFFTDDGEHEAVLLLITNNVYFWAESSLDLDKATLEEIADRLENEYYPQLVYLFGQEWRPGVDGDDRFNIMHLDTEGGSELGYFSSIDVYPNTLYSDSNEMEVVYLNMGNLALGSDLYYGTLVHEIQHLIQWYIDPNEETWMNEGLSQLAEIYLGLETADASDFLRNPAIQVNRWNYDDAVIDAHYSASYLFAVYVWEQLGETAVQDLSRHPANGMAAVQAILPGYDGRSFDTFIADWSAANYLDNPAAGPAYTYQALTLRAASLEAEPATLPTDQTGTLGQFGTHYIDLSDLRGPVTLSFAGDTIINLTDGPPSSGNLMWYVPPMDELGASMTRAFDLSGVNSATLKFGAWYDLEEEWDFAYVTASTDGGQTWEILSPVHGRAGEYGPAFNGRSAAERTAVNGWVKESISLNRYAGQEILIRFEVYTDSAVTGRGFAIDDIAIPEIGYETNSETGPDGWEAQGFIQIGWQIPQQWVVQFIEEGPQPTVTRLELDGRNQLQTTLDIGKAGGVIAITPMTPFVEQAAAYWLKLEQ